MHGFAARRARSGKFKLDLRTEPPLDFRMPIAHHPLITEFPEHRDAIHSLKEENAHFQKLMASYEETDKEIFRMEEGIETPEDTVLTGLKKRRLELKDEIAAMLQASEA